MTRAAFVCPFDRELLDRIRERTLIVRTTDPAQVMSIRDHIAGGSCRLQLIVLEYDGALTALDIDPRWQGLPLRVVCQTMGPYEELSARIPLLRSLGIAAFLPSCRRENFDSVRILASLGIPSGLVLTPETPAWDLARDLLHYQAYAQTAHADIEPFASVMADYDPERDLSFADVFHENPRTCLHLAPGGMVAATRVDLEAGKFLDVSLDNIATVGELEQYRVRCLAGRQHFLDFDTCSTCVAWRVCGGTFRTASGPEGGCAAFFTDLLEACEFRGARADKARSSTCRS